MPKILIVDDDATQLNVLRRVLLRENYEVQTAEDGETALKFLEDQNFDAIISDMRMGKVTGRDLLRSVKTNFPELPVLIVTAYAELADAIDLVAREGAFYYLEKPIDLEILKSEIARAIGEKNRDPIDENREEIVFEEIVGESEVMHDLFKTMSLIIRRGANQVLITGDTGTGKELVANAIHKYGKRRDLPFFPINCGAIPEDLIESELFGHEKGAFTSADQLKKGIFEIANGGTVFLDEIGDISPRMQSKLLRVIQEREIKRVGGMRPIKVDLCIIAATNKILKDEIANGNFREDLYFRINVIPLNLPPLKDRVSDIPLMIDFFLDRFSAEYPAVGRKTITPSAMDALQKYDWIGNVRHLENCLLRSFILSENETIDLQDLPTEIHDKTLPPSDLNVIIPESGVSLEAIVKKYIEATLAQTNGNQTKAAELLGMSRRRLQSRMKTFQIDRRDFKK